MKTIAPVCQVMGAVLIGLPSIGEAKNPPPPPVALSARALLAKPPHWRAAARDWASTEWQATEWVTNEVTGYITEQTKRRYTELGDGLNYLDEAGQWRGSKDLVEATTNGAAAVRGPTKVWFANRITEGITIQTRSNNVLRIRPLGLFYFDAQSGESAQIATVRDCEGEVLPPNSVVYRGVLDSLRADLRYVWSRGMFESDLILRERPRPPEAYHLNNRTTRLELWHAFGDDPVPRRTPIVLEGETDPVLRATMTEPELIEETLDFGDLWFPMGYAFSLDGAQDASTNGVGRRPELPGQGRAGRLPVAKRLVRLGERTGLVESVPWERVRQQLEALPAPNQGASLLLPSGQRRKGRVLPPLNETASRAPRAMKIASVPYQPAGFCLDYIAVSGGGSYTFSANTTYYLSSPVTFNGVVTFSQNSVIKYGPGASLTLCGSAVCNGTAVNPTILTSKDENLYGETISGSSGFPTANAGNPAVSLYYAASDITLSGMRFRWAQRAISASHYSPMDRTYGLANSSVEHCPQGVYAGNCTFVLQNSTKCSVGTPIAYAGVVLSGSLSDACEATLGEAVEQPGWVYSNAGNANWLRQTSMAWDGIDAAQSGSITDGQASSFQATLAPGPGIISFYWRVSSEANYDLLRFFIDGVPQAVISGEQDWAYAGFPISAGAHTFEWQYSKDGSGSSGADAGWVDYIQFTPGPGSISLGEAVDNTSLSWTSGGSANWFCQGLTYTSGNDAAQSGAINDSESTYMETSVNGSGTVSFYWKVSSESGYDYLKFFIDGTEQDAISGEVDWTCQSYSVGSGGHALRWEYSKDGSSSTGADAGWVDLVQFSAGVGVAPVITIQPQSQTVAVRSNVTFFAGASGAEPFSYQWTFNGAPILTATSTSYSIVSVLPSHAGAYAMIANNAYGSATSSIATLTVTASTCSLPPNGMAAWWTGDNTAGDQVNSNTVCLLNGAGFTSSGKVLQSFSFDGWDDYAYAPDSPSLNPTTGLTVEAWVRPTGSTSQNMPLVSKDGCYSARQYFLTVSEYGRFRAHVGTTNGLVYCNGGTALQQYTWYHVAMTYDGSALRLYVNGNPDGSASASGDLITTSQPVDIGGSTSGPWGNYKFAGCIDEPTIYSRALSLAEIQRIVAAGAAGKCVQGDSDGDGLPDAWELQYFGNLNQTANGDYDADGFSNYQEYLLNTNPATPAVPDAGQINLRVFTPLK